MLHLRASSTQHHKTLFVVFVFVVRLRRSNPEVVTCKRLRFRLVCLWKISDFDTQTQEQRVHVLRPIHRIVVGPRCDDLQRAVIQLEEGVTLTKIVVTVGLEVDGSLGEFDFDCRHSEIEATDRLSRKKPRRYGDTATHYDVAQSQGSIL